ncbi:hormogonium polysaccharide secretion pseudopilin HpsB [Cylindrospermum sp. FACHB-282]|uniref:hormogonium polysaccharide secretion pseudopilin HpsB n=1 Tax=Cylindrospermum sp. FACHB-282 TaxID=2692794 RepID=UPI001689FA22|nr:hormogonium polysaccharide secretion pseudopilin HpsB [Cylindrospermum sp. FACHB-282]MBD2385710.1 type II secretion system protein [Cylindrospermum sp. FACHB-282]
MIQRKQQQSPSSDDSGFTIIESLVAILVVGILLTAIAPVIFLSTATRVQSRRVELATQAAKTYIEGIRTGLITTPSTVTVLDVATQDSPRSVANNPGDYLINLTNMPVPTSATGLYCFKKDGTISDSNCTDNLFYIQARRISVTTAAETDTNKLLLAGYRLGIRVYRSDVNFAQATASTSSNKKTQTAVTGGLGDRQAPLIEMTTDITSTNRFTPTTFTALCQRLGVATNKNCD